jgi:hypothetical protein
MARHQSAAHKDNIKVINKYFESMTDFKYLRNTTTNEVTLMKKLKADDI